MNPDLDISDLYHIPRALLLLKCVETVCEEYISELQDPVPGPLYLQWGEDNVGHDSSVFLDLNDNRRLQAFIQLMRAPGPYDGGSTYVFERYMDIAISLVYEPRDITWVGYVLNIAHSINTNFSIRDMASWYDEVKFTKSAIVFPLLVVGKSSRRKEVAVP